MLKKDIILIKEGYWLLYAGQTFRAGNIFKAPLDLADLLIREGKALPYKPTILPELRSNA